MDNFDLAVNIIKNAVLDDIIESISMLDLKGEDINTIISCIAHKKSSNTKLSITSKTKQKTKRREISSDRQCTRYTKTGQPCRSMRTNDTSCWGHMTPDEKMYHRKDIEQSSISSSINNTVPLTDDEQRLLENYVDE